VVEALEFPGQGHAIAAPAEFAHAVQSAVSFITETLD